MKRGDLCADFPTPLLFTPLEKVLFSFLCLMLAGIIWSTLYESYATVAGILAGIPLLVGFLLLTKRKDR